MNPEEKIEILSVDLLGRYRSLVESIRQEARLLRIGLGWHYLLDVTWILAQLDSIAGKHIVDAGAGIGIIQWYLADHQAKVLSVDQSSRALLPLRFRYRYRVCGLRAEDLSPAWEVVRNNVRTAKGFIRKCAKCIRDGADLIRSALPLPRRGSVIIYNQNLRTLADLPDDSVDIVVSVSALEHNPPEVLPEVVSELMRVIKPGGVLLATLPAAKTTDWYHKPSRGWCYTLDSLKRYFQLPVSVPENYAHYDALFSKLRDCAELRDNLANFYFLSGDNGMPWGKWDPQYQPVGVCKVKR